MGKGWDMIYAELLQWIVRLLNLGVGVVFVSHQKNVKVLRRHREITRLLTSLPATARRVLLPRVDFILRIGYVEEALPKKGKKVVLDDDERRVFMRPSPYSEVGSWGFSSLDDVPESIPYGYAHLAQLFKRISTGSSSAPQRKKKKKRATR
jgi:hypothetical protein